MNLKTLETLEAGVTPESDDAQWLLQLPILKPATLRQSSVGTFATCPRKFLFRHRFGLTRAGHKSAPFIGQLFHLAHAARYTGSDDLSVSRTVQRAVDSYHALLTQWADETGSVEDASRLTAEVERDAALSMAMSKIHWDKFPLDASRFEVVSVEQDLEAELPGIKTPIGGRIDLVLRYTGSDGLVSIVIVDFKTTRKPFEAFITQAMNSTQARLYRILVDQNRHRLGITRGGVDAILFDLVKRPTIRWKQWQEWSDYLQEVSDWYEGRQATILKNNKPAWDHRGNLLLWGKEPPFDRKLVYYGETLYPEDLLHKMRLLDSANTAETPLLRDYPTFGADNGSCTNFFGSCCEFLPLCGGDTSSWENDVTRLYLQADVTAVEAQPQEDE